MLAILTKELTKTFNGSGGCQEINLELARGHVFGLLGPNGAGKSTLVKTLLGLQRPTGGRAEVLGHPPGARAALARTGYLPELFRYHDWLSGEDLLRVHGSLYRLPGASISRRIPEVLELVGLKGKGRQKVKTYSKGMQQRIGLACALMPDPELLFLDEPTSALDPIGRREIRDLLRFLKERGTTVFLNSHLLSEVETVCDQIGIINNSRLVVSGSFAELQAGPLQATITLGWSGQPAQLPENWHQQKCSGPRIVLNGPVEDEQALARLVGQLVRQGALIYEVRQEKRSLEDLFVYWVSQRAEGGACHGTNS